MTSPIPPMKTAAPDERMWFVSDVHLVDGDEAYLAQFLGFLEAAEGAGLSSFWVFGDLFEFWIGDRQGLGPFYQPLFDAIRRLTEGGTRVLIVHGNRDFLMGSVFEDAGAEILPEEVALELAGKSLHLSHGDQFCLQDRSYQRARVVFRSAPIRFLSRILPAWLGGFLARSYRGISEKKKARKKMQTGNRFHTIEDGVRITLEEGGYDLLLCGHIHHFAETELVVAGRPRLVLTTGAWEEIGPNYVAYENGSLELRRFGPAN